MKEIRRSKKGTGISRRKFLEKTAAASVGIAFVPILGGMKMDEKQTGNWPADAGKYRFHLIGQAHIDPVWLWPWQEGIAVVHSTFRSALDRMNETPEFAFTASSAQFYEWVADNDPGMLEEIKKRICRGTMECCRWLVGRT